MIQRCVGTEIPCSVIATIARLTATGAAANLPDSARHANTTNTSAASAPRPHPVTTSDTECAFSKIRDTPTTIPISTPADTPNARTHRRPGKHATKKATGNTADDTIAWPLMPVKSRSRTPTPHPMNAIFVNATSTLAATKHSQPAHGVTPRITKGQPRGNRERERNHDADAAERSNGEPKRKRQVRHEDCFCRAGKANSIPAKQPSKIFRGSLKITTD